MRLFLKKIILKFYRSTILKIINILLYYRDYFTFLKIKDNRFEVSFWDRLTFINEKVSSTSFDKHYLYHTAWAARILAHTKPEEHTDIGSCLRFVSIASAFISLRFFDLRPPNLKLSNLKSVHANLKSLPFSDESVNSYFRFLFASSPTKMFGNLTIIQLLCQYDAQ